MASFLLSEVFVVEKIIASGHADLDDLTCEATVCIEAHQAYCEATKHMIRCALEKNCDSEEEDSLRYELVKTMRRRGLSAEKRYQRIKEVLIGASRTFSAEKTYFNVKRTPILAACVVDEERMITDALQLLGESEGKDPSAAGCSSARKATPRDKSMKGRGRVLPPLPANEEGLARMKRARFVNDFGLHH